MVGTFLMWWRVIYKLKSLFNYFDLKQEAAIVIIFQMGFLFVNLLLVKLITANLTQSDYGYFALGLTIVAFISQVIFGGANAAITRYYLDEQKSDQIGQFTTFVFIYYLFTNLAGAVLFYIFALQNQSIEIFHLASLCIYASLYVFNALFISIANITRKRFLAGVLNFSDIFLKYLLFLILIKFSTINLFDALLLSYLIGTFTVFCFFVCIIFRSDGKFFKLGLYIPRIDSVKAVVYYAIPYLPWTLLLWVQQVIDRWLLNEYLNKEVVGIYFAYFQISYSLVVTGVAVIIKIVEPIYYNEFSNVRDMGFERILLAFMFSGFSLVLIVLIIFRIEFISILLPTNYLPYSWLILPFFVSGVMTGMSEFFLLRMQALKKSGLLSASKMKAATVGVFVSIVFVPLYGLTGVVTSMFISSFALYFIMWRSSCKKIAI